MRIFYIAGLVAWCGIIAAVMLQPRGSDNNAQAAFNARWKDVPTEVAPLKKQDRIADRVISTDRVFDPPPVGVDIPTATPNKPASLIKDVDIEPTLTTAAVDDTVHVHRRHKTRKARDRGERNICTRHGMRKVVTRGGRSWRCRRR